MTNFSLMKSDHQMLCCVQNLKMLHYNLGRFSHYRCCNYWILGISHWKMTCWLSVTWVCELERNIFGIKTLFQTHASALSEYICWYQCICSSSYSLPTLTVAVCVFWFLPGFSPSGSWLTGHRAARVDVDCDHRVFFCCGFGDTLTEGWVNIEAMLAPQPRWKFFGSRAWKILAEA